jgi:uncharacterized membrane protein YccC
MRNFLMNHKGLLFSFRIALGCIIVWWSLDYLHDSKKVWALISVIIVSDPDIENLRAAALSRVINTITGCIIGLIFIYVTGVNFWSLMVAIIVAVFIATSFKNYPSSWRLAPATVAIIMVPAIAEGAPWKEAMIIAVSRTGEVLYGCLVALVLGIVISEIRKRYA